MSTSHRNAIAALCKPPLGIAFKDIEHTTCFRYSRQLPLADADVANITRGISKHHRALSALVTLCIGGPTISDGGIAVLVDAMAEGHLATLTDLTVTCTGMTDVGVKTFADLFARSGALRWLRILRLHDNHISDVGTLAIAGACFKGGVPSLLRLDLDYNRIGDAGLQALTVASVSGTLAKVTYLSLRGNRIGDAGVASLNGRYAAGSVFPSLSQLVLHRNEVGNAGCLAIAAACSTGALPALRDIYLFQFAPALQAACESRGIRYH